MLNATDVLLHLMPWRQYLVATGQALHAYIRTSAGNKPFVTAAGVRLFHGKRISQTNIHTVTYFLMASQ